MTYDDHISIDLETMGTQVGAPIISIGAIQFDPDTGKLGRSFYSVITPESAFREPFRVDPSTLCWWMTQSDAARRVFATRDDRQPLAVALDELATFCRSIGTPKVWGNGATFDISLLEYAYKHGAVGQQPGWHFTNIRDMRTIVDLAGLYDEVEWPFPRTGVHHNALDDAAYQAQIISYCWQKLRGLTNARGATPKNETGKSKSKPVIVSGPAIYGNDDEI